MITIESKDYGAVEVDEEKQIYLFEGGIPAFEHLTRWALFEADRAPFFIFQSLDERDVAFFVMNPWLCRKDYEVKLEQGDLFSLGLNSADSDAVMIFSILSIPIGEPHLMSINLQAPLVFNQTNQQGMQVILSDHRWGIRHIVSQELAREGEASC